MTLKERNAAMWERGEVIGTFVGLWVMMGIFAALFPAVVRQLECANCSDPAPTIGIFSLLPLLVIVGVVLLLVGWALGVWKTPISEDVRG